MKLILLIILLCPVVSSALDCTSKEEIISRVKLNDYGILNLHIFKSKNMRSKDIDGNLKECSWGKIEFFEYGDYESYPAFKVQYICNGMLSQYIEFSGTCHKDKKSVAIHNIFRGIDEGQFP